MEQWKAQLDRRSDLRLIHSSSKVVTPDGSVIEIPHREGDAEVHFQAESSWYPVFRFKEGEISFNATVDWEDESSIVRRIAIDLAIGLQAQIVGDEGEIYFQ